MKEEVVPLIDLIQKRTLADTKALALDSAHRVAFHRGLGNPLHQSSTVWKKYVERDTIEYFSKVAYAKSNIAITANGADSAAVSKWVGEFFSGAPAAAPGDGPAIESQQTKYHGGEERIANTSGNTIVLAFPGSSSSTGAFYKPEIQVLASLLGGASSIKWSPGFSLLSKAIAGQSGVSVETKSDIYSDAGLLTVAITGSAKDVTGAAYKAVEKIKKVAAGEISAEDFSKAVAQAKFKELEHGQNIWGSLELTGAGLIHGGKAYQLDETAQKIGSVTQDQLKKVGCPCFHLVLPFENIG